MTPLYATADGGAIVTSTQPPCQPTWVVAPFGTPACPLSSQSQAQLGTLYTVDQNGNVTSQTPDPGAILSWSDQSYDPAPSVPTISALALPAPDWGYGAGAFGFGSPDKVSVWVDRCPALDIVTFNLAEKAVTDLSNLLAARACPLCDSKVFAPLNAQKIHPRPEGLDQTVFASYLGAGHRFCDPTMSKEPAATIGAGSGTIADYFASKAGADEDARTVLGTRMWSYFRPAGTTDTTIRLDAPRHNEAMILHEGLHGWGFIDGRLLYPNIGLCWLIPDENGAVGLCLGGETVRITNWIDQEVLPAP